MKLYIVLLPKTDISNTIIRLRKESVDRGLSKVDPRAKALPHTTIISIEEDIKDEKAKDIIESLNNFQYELSITLPLIDVVNWDHKVVAMFNTVPLTKLKYELDMLMRKTNVEFNTEYKILYGDTIGDHMKLVRQVSQENIEEVKTIVRNTLPKEIIYNRIALIKYGCEEKDILWNRQLVV